MRLGRLRPDDATSRSAITCATSSGWSFQSAPAVGLAAVEAGRHRARADVGDPDAVVAHLLHQRLAEGVEAGLGGAVGGAAGKRVLPGQAADVDDPAGRRALRCGIAAWQQWKTPVRLVSISRDHSSGVMLGDRPADADAGVVDEHVEAAEALHRRVDGAAHGGAVAHVAGHAHHAGGVVDRRRKRVLGAQDARRRSCR